MMHRRIFLLFMLLLGTASVYASGEGIVSDSKIVEIITGAIAKSADKLLTETVKWLSLFMLLQFLITNYKLLPSADLDSAMAKFVGSLIWFGACWYIMEVGPIFIKSVGLQFWNVFANKVPTPGTILNVTLGITAAMFGVAIGAGATVVGTVFGQILAIAAFTIIGIGAYFAAKVFLLQLEIALIALLSPLSFSLLGLNALRDQGIAPFKSLLALVYRIVLLGVIFSAYAYIGDALSDVLSKYAGFNWDTLTNVVKGGKDMIEAIFAALISLFLLAGLLWKSDAIAASLAGGNSSLGAADIAGATAAGVTAGMAAHTAAQALNRPAQGIRDVMQALGGNNKVGMNNVSSTGSREADSGLSKPDLGGNMSTSGEGGDSGGGASEAAHDESGRDAGASLSPNPNEFTGVKNPLPDSAPKDAGRDAAREARRQARQGGSGSDAAISGGSGDVGEQLKELKDSLGQRHKPTFRDRAKDLNQQVAQERPPTHVSINTHHD